MMPKPIPSADVLLQRLAELSSQLRQAVHGDTDYFAAPLQLINEAMGFHVSVLYRVTNAIEHELLLEVVAVSRQLPGREELYPGARIVLDSALPAAHFVNEVAAFKTRGISAINVPGTGCDLVGSVDLPASLGPGYLLAGDYLGDEAAVQPGEIHAFTLMCNLLGVLLMKLEFEQLAIHDALTGVLSSRAIRAELEQWLTRQRRRRQGRCAVVLCDIDHFKKINDGHGHLQGDSVLQEVGALFAASLRQHCDRGGRYGGEEFLLLYDDLDVDSILIIVERLRALVEQHEFVRIGEHGQPLAGESLRVTMSFGIAMLDAGSLENAAEVLARAEAALYQAKEAGRNRLQLAA